MSSFEKMGNMYMGKDQAKQSADRKATYERGAGDAREAKIDKKMKMIEQGKGYEDCEVINGIKIWVVWTDAGYEIAYRRVDGKDDESWKSEIVTGGLNITRIGANSLYARKIFNDIIEILDRSSNLSPIQIDKEIEFRRSAIIPSGELDPRGLLDSEGHEKESSY